ncbi:hypothetical protein PpBr36_04722 [Pyricularia pennisetigena]|uniref:hypothetical protein n=1 Tax=Pyricularia pennisetigena TaxID=1578925 RepID=UPI0011533E75|nr:hypothetical protein PpBr36_04722 [Pyricularia pennisetigena]TLS26259.1 hypothetical protein PpBr36_04722 [Pyricularia pennisetigena]
MKELAQTQPLSFKTTSGLTPLHVAAAGLHYDLVRFHAGHIGCRSATTSLQLRQAKCGWIALHYAAAATELKAVIQLLLHTSNQSAGQDLGYVRDSKGRLAQHIFRLQHLSRRHSAGAKGVGVTLAYFELQRLLSPQVQGGVRRQAELDDLMAFRLLTDDELAVCIQTPLYVQEYFVWYLGATAGGITASSPTRMSSVSSISCMAKDWTIWKMLWRLKSFVYFAQRSHLTISPGGCTC